MVAQRPRTDALVRRGRRAHKRALAARARRQRRTVWAVGVAIVLIVVAMIVARVLFGNQPPVAAEAPVPPDSWLAGGSLRRLWKRRSVPILPTAPERR